MKRLRRFVLHVSKPDDEVLHDTTIELRAVTALDAMSRAEAFDFLKVGAVLTLIGERKGVMSDQRLTPFVAIERLPMHIVQNERFCKTDEPKRLARLAEVAA